MNKLFIFLAGLAWFGSAIPAHAWDNAVPCYSRPGPRQQREELGIARTSNHVRFRTPRTEQRYVRDEIMTLLMNISLLSQKDVTVTSGYRSCEYTKAIRGRNLSQHTQGIAVDFKVPGLDRKQHFEICRRAGGRGCGLYCGDFGHIDLGKTRSWNHCRRKK